MQMATSEKLMFHLNPMYCLFPHSKVTLMNEMGSIPLLLGLGFVKGRALSVTNAATLQILGMTEERDISEIKCAIHVL